jgi:hypothetical protein
MVEMLCSRFVDRWNPDLPPTRSDRPSVYSPAELIDAAELARRLGVARSTVYANSRRYGAIRLGDSRNSPLRFDYAAVLASLPRVGQEPVELLVPSLDRPIIKGAPRFSADQDLIP